jgi:hypothetical protein
LPKLLNIDKENLPPYIKIEEVLMFVCQCCNHEWTPRKENWAPYKCPLCQALGWKGDEDDQAGENLGGFAGDVGPGC